MSQILSTAQMRQIRADREELERYRLTGLTPEGVVQLMYHYKDLQGLAGGPGHDTKLFGGEQMTITKKKSALAENLRRILSEEDITVAMLAEWSGVSV